MKSSLHTNYRFIRLKKMFLQQMHGVHWSKSWLYLKKNGKALARWSYHWHLPKFTSTTGVTVFKIWEVFLLYIYIYIYRQDRAKKKKRSNHRPEEVSCWLSITRRGIMYSIMCLKRLEEVSCRLSCDRRGIM